MGLRIAASLVPILALSACSSNSDADVRSGAGADSRPTSRPASRPAAGAAVSHAAFDSMLREYVDGELVDYAGWRANDSGALDAYLDRLAAVDPETLGRDARLAFYINLYNATMVDAILDRLAPGYSTSDDDFAVFDEKLVRLDGETVSLNHLEHEIVRKQFDEPRIHTALVCGARSCPPLLPRAYRAEDLDAVLEANMKAFVTDGKRNRIGGKVELSQLFNWYADDFGGKDQVLEYVSRYAGTDLTDRGHSFLEYSWELNAKVPGTVSPRARGR